MDDVVDSDMLCGGMSIGPFEVHKAVAGSPCRSVGGPKGCDEGGLPMCGCSTGVNGGIVVFLYWDPFGAEDAGFRVMPAYVGLVL